MAADHPELGRGLHYLCPANSSVVRMPSRLRVGSVIVIKGQVPDGATKFAVDFQKGSDVNASDIAFHFSCRFYDSSVVLRNDRVRGTWNKEELDIPGKFPFSIESAFHMVITVTEKHFKVVVNDETVCEFKHRHPIDYPTHLGIKGDFNISRLTLADPLSPTMLATIPSTLKLGDKYIIHGNPTSSTDADFSVHVQENDLDDSNVLLCVNPRMKSNYIVRNSREDNVWGTEEIDAGTPFYSTNSFALAIDVLERHFEITANGVKFADFKHRQSYESAKLLVIKGDISITNVIIERPSSKLRTGQGVYVGLNPAFYTIPGNFPKGKTLHIIGTPQMDCTSIILQLQTGEMFFTESLLSMKVDFTSKPRMFLISNVMNDSKTNTRQDYKPVPFPFELGVEFEFTVLNDGSKFCGQVNGKEIFTLLNPAPNKLADTVVLQSEPMIYIKSICYT